MPQTVSSCSNTASPSSLCPLSSWSTQDVLSWVHQNSRAGESGYSQCQAAADARQQRMLAFCHTMKPAPTLSSCVAQPSGHVPLMT